jgi:stage II sporulation protein R
MKNLYRAVFLLKKLDVLTVSMLAGGIAAFAAAGFSAFAADCEKMPEQIFRLHIIANSNSEEDQNLKYELRDYMLGFTQELFKDCSSPEQAEMVARENIDEIQRRADDFAASKGVTDKVTAEVTKMFFTTRVYGSTAVPAGTYRTLRLTVGSGKGKNWWCVMYPSLCVPAAYSKETSAVAENGRNVQVKFAAFEFLQKLVNR